MKFKKIWIFWGILCLILVCNLYNFYIYRFMNMKTETASNCIVSEVIETEGFAVRDETIINGSDIGRISYKVSDSEKIAKGGLIAKIYENSQDEILDSELCKIEEEIKILKKLRLVSKYDIREPDNLGRDINKKITNMEDQIIKENYTEIHDNRKKIIKLIDERRISIGKNDNFDQRIKYLEDKKNNLEKDMSRYKLEITSPSDGYFVSFLDGYEDSIAYNCIKHSNTYNFDINEILPNVGSPNNIGKLINSGDWYIICRVPKSDALRMKIGSTYELKLSLCNLQYLPCKILNIRYVNPDEVDIVISCNYFNREICKFRKGSIKIKINDYYGAKIEKRAICYKNTENFKNNIPFNELSVGVNVKCGDVITFKKISILYSSDSYVVCSLEEDYGKNSSFLRSGDQVVLEGTNLYDGKLIKC